MLRGFWNPRFEGYVLGVLCDAVHVVLNCVVMWCAVQVRLGLPATQWITVYNAHRPMKQRYHYNVANVRVEQHVVKGNDDGLYISSVACCQVRAVCCALH